MISVPDEEFDSIVGDAIDRIPAKYLESLKNVAFVTEDLPTDEQRARFKLTPEQTLFGLYDGVPLTKRGGVTNVGIPDKITIFKLPILATSQSLEEVKEQVGRTVWHEVAHYFGLDHQRIHALERKEKNEQK